MLDRYAKAIVGSAMAFLSALGVALSDGHVTPTEWVVAASAAVASLALVWGVPNSAPLALPAEPPAPPTIASPVPGRYPPAP